LAEEGEVRYADEAHSGAKTRGYDASMKRAARCHPLGRAGAPTAGKMLRKLSDGARCEEYGPAEDYG